jgi:hypothetical protein
VVKGFSKMAGRGGEREQIKLSHYLRLANLKPESSLIFSFSALDAPVVKGSDSGQGRCDRENCAWRGKSGSATMMAG